MKNDDQWFKPGDKVVKVSDSSAMEIDVPGTPDAIYGKVYCVSYCWHNYYHENNWVNFVGFPERDSEDGARLGFLAADFRKVEEIQLCVRAAEALKKPKKQEEMA